jgi:DNA-3-methyladenine glycosylase II
VTGVQTCALPISRPLKTEADLVLAAQTLAAQVPDFGPVIDRAGPIPLRHIAPGFRGLATVIVGQMVSRASADAIWQRFEARLGTVSAAAILASFPDDLRATGLSGAKERTLRALAENCRDGLDLEALVLLPGCEAEERLTAIPGIGAWTAEVYLLFSAGHPDIFPAGDVALQNAAAHAFGLVKRPDARALRAISAEWQPLRSIAARVLWAYYARAMRRDATPVAASRNI